MIPIHEEKAEYASWLRLLVIFPLGLFIGAIVMGFKGDLEAFAVLLGEGFLFALIFYFILPRKFEIYNDRLRIVLGNPFGINIPLTTIKEARRSSANSAWVYSGIRFATSSRNVVEISRSKGLNYVISPRNSDLFVEQLNQALKRMGL